MCSLVFLVWEDSICAVLLLLLVDGYRWIQFEPFFVGPPVQISVNMNIRSMGPISEVDSVSVRLRLHYQCQLLPPLIH